MRNALLDSLRVLYKRRWVAVPVFLAAVLYAAASTFRTTPIYEATTKVLIEKESSSQTGQQSAAPDEAFYQTQFSLMRSRALAWRTLTSLGQNQPPTEAELRARAEEDARLARGGWLERLAVTLGAPNLIPPATSNETAWQSARIDAFLANLIVAPEPFTRLVDVRFRSPDPAFAARAADAAADTFVAQGAVAQVIDAAEIPRLPVLPKRERDLTLGLIVGLVLAIGLAFGLEYIDSRIRTPDDIKNHLGLPFLGLVPAVKRKKIKGPSPLINRGVPAPFSESMRGLRTSIIFSSTTDGSRRIMLTSTAPSEGKTVIACNLGDVLAQADQRTIVIDGDMRRPRVHEVFQLAQEPGLSNVLAGDVALTAAVRQVTPFLHVLPAGLIPPNPAELLSSDRYLRLLDELGQTYEWIVIDAPPVMAVTDAAIISSSAHGVVFVVGSEMTPRRNAQIALEQLVGVRARIVGAVLNRVRVDKHAFYYSQYYRKEYTKAYVRTP